MEGLVYTQRYDYSWYGPTGHTRTDARRIAARDSRCSPGRIRAVRQASGAWLYLPPTDGPAGVTLWIPGQLLRYHIPDASWRALRPWLDEQWGGLRRAESA